MKDKTEISVLYSSGGFQDGFFNPPSSPSRLCGRLTKHSDCPHGRPGDAEDGALIVYSIFALYQNIENIRSV